MYESPVQVSLEFTPNPNTLKYSTNRILLEKGAMNFLSLNDATGKSALVEKLFQVAGIEAVMVGRDFVTVTKSETGDWDTVHQGSMLLLEDYLNRKEPIINPILGKLGIQGEPTGTSEIERKIINIINTEIRPAVAKDGGDITFERFEDGTVYVYLQGSCAGCPSSTMTLKVGIEERLKRDIVEVLEVVSI